MTQCQTQTSTHRQRLGISFPETLAHLSWLQTVTECIKVVTCYILMRSVPGWACIIVLTT